MGRQKLQEGAMWGAHYGGREGGEGGKENRELKTIYKLIQCHVYLIYVNLHICIYAYAERNWERELRLILTSYIH